MGKSNIPCRNKPNCKCKICQTKKKKVSKQLNFETKSKNNYKFLYWDV